MSRHINAAGRVISRSSKSDAEAERLAKYVRSLGDAFKIYTKIDGNYDHIGATIADAVLQANRDYEKIVRPRVKGIRERLSEYNTTTTLNRLLETMPVKRFLDYNGTQRQKRFRDVLSLFTSEGIDTEEDLRGWLSDDANVIKLRGIKGIGPKTTDYFKILVGLQTAAIDRRLEAFLKSAKVEYSGYDEARAIVNTAANQLGCKCSHFDHSIWRYVGEILSMARTCLV